MTTQTTEFVVAVVHSQTDIELLAHTDATLRSVADTADVGADWVRSEILKLHESRLCSLILVSREVELVDWTRQPTGRGNPLFRARLGPLDLTVSVGRPWVWAWTVCVPLSGGQARENIASGWISVEHNDDQDQWNYQDSDGAQARCEAVAEAIFSQLEAAADMHES